jgi:hypothetical protein
VSGKKPQNYTPYQEKIIKRYYQNFDGIAVQRLSELVGEIYLAEGKKGEKLWVKVGELLPKLGIGAARIEHILQTKDPNLLASLVSELTK